MDNIIETKDIHKYFPGVHALDGINFTLVRGEILGLVGENGAGKSTLNKVLSGVEKYDAGTYLLEGKPVFFKNASEAIAAGISVIHQELNLCDSLSVAHNICIGRYPLRLGLLVDNRESNRIAAEALAQVGLSDIPPAQKVELLSTAQKQLVEVARAISQGSKILIMDEPTSALAPNEIEILHNVMRQLQKKGVSIIYISHKLDDIFAVCNRVSIMRDGKLITTRTIDEISKEEMISLMVGRQVSELFQRNATSIGDTVLEVEGLTNEKVRNVSFYVRAGEIVCFSGLMGAGRTETMKAIFGFDGRTSGIVRVDGKTLAPNSTEKARKLGIGFISEDRKLEGIFPFFTVADNMSLVELPNLSLLRFFIPKKKVRNVVEQGIRNFRVKATGPHQIMATLSGGNQQKVLLARWLVSHDIRLLIIDEPTRGIDVGAKSEIYALLNDLANQGLAVICVSSEMQEIINICDRVYVMKNGTITGELLREEVTQTRLMEYAIL